MDVLDSFSNIKIIFTAPNADTDGRVIKQMIEDFTAPSKQQQIKGPEHYARHTKPQFSKSNESTILNLFYRLGI